MALSVAKTTGRAFYVLERRDSRVIEFLKKDMEVSHVARFETTDFRVLVEFIKELGG